MFRFIVRYEISSHALDAVGTDHQIRFKGRPICELKPAGGSQGLDGDTSLVEVGYGWLYQAYDSVQECGPVKRYGSEILLRRT
jgi:hypothetical protein